MVADIAALLVGYMRDLGWTGQEGFKQFMEKFDRAPAESETDTTEKGDPHQGQAPLSLAFMISSPRKKSIVNLMILALSAIWP